jgi:DtxR family Mn-dependent transcriptional regulator
MIKKVTPSKEDYLKAIWTLSERETTAPRQEAMTSDLAVMLQVSPPAVSKMIKQMQKQALVAHTPYYGVRLTEKGRLVALRIVRRHRLLELFLAKVLNYSLDTVHDEAERLEHHISATFEEKIDALLGHPEYCPHGSPIPKQNGTFSIKGSDRR